MKKILLFAFVVLVSMAVHAQNEAKEVVPIVWTKSGVMTELPIDFSTPSSRAEIVFLASALEHNSNVPGPGLYRGDRIYGLRLSGYNTGKALKRHIKVWMRTTMYDNTTTDMACVYDGDCTISHGGETSVPATLLELFLSEPFEYTSRGDLRLVIESEGDVSDGESLFSTVTFMVTSQPVTLTGKVTDQDGQPVKSAEVTFTGEAYKRKYNCQTKADGTYSIVIGDSNQSYLASVSGYGGFPYYSSEVFSFMVNGDSPKTRDFVICNELKCKPGKMSTIILPFDPDPTVGRYYRLDRIENGAVVFERETSPKAEVPYVLFPEHEYTIKVEELRDNISMRWSSPFYTRVFTERPAGHEGHYKSAELTGAYYSLDFYIGNQKNDILLLDDDPCSEYITYEDNSIAGARPGAFHAVLRTYWMPEPIKCVFNGETTEVTITTIKNHVNAESVFDLQGRRLAQKPTKGVYIQNGKKVIVR